MMDTRTLLAVYEDPEVFKEVYFGLIDPPHREEDYRKALQMLKEANYLEDLAILYDSEAVDEEFVVRSLGYIAVYRWDTRWKGVADEYRRRTTHDHFPAWRKLVERIRDDPRLG